VLTPYGASTMPSIFVQIASYEDPELYSTISDAVAKSSGLMTINFGVHASYVNPNGFSIPPKSNTKVTHSFPPNNIGVARSRRIADSFYDGEDFYLQIDAHSRFKKNWDEFLVYEYYRYKGLGIDNPLITAYPMPFWYEDGKEFYQDVDFVHTIDLTHDKQLFLDWRHPKQSQVINTKHSVFTPSVSAGSIFAKGKVPIPSKEIFFDGEEITIAAMAYTQGYDIVLPQAPYMYHLYYSTYKETDTKRKIVWQEWPAEYAELNSLSKEHIKNTFLNNVVGEGHLGDKRTLKEFSEFCGLDFETGAVQPTCY